MHEVWWVQRRSGRVRKNVHCNRHECIFHLKLECPLKILRYSQKFPQTTFQLKRFYTLLSLGHVLTSRFHRLHREWTWKRLQIQLVRMSITMCNVPEQRSWHSDYFWACEESWFAFRQGKGDFLYTKTPWQDLGLTTRLSDEYPGISLPGKSGQVVNLATYPQLMPRLRKNETLLPFLQKHFRPRPPRAVSGPVEKIFWGPRRKDIPAKNIYTKSDRLTVSCQVTRAWCERFHLYHRQKLMLPTKLKTNSRHCLRHPQI